MLTLEQFGLNGGVKWIGSDYFQITARAGKPIGDKLSWRSCKLCSPNVSLRRWGQTSHSFRPGCLRLSRAEWGLEPTIYHQQAWLGEGWKSSSESQLGEPPKEIAAEFRISPRTAEAHRANILHKLGFHSHAELILFALQNNVV